MSYALTNPVLGAAPKSRPLDAAWSTAPETAPQRVGEDRNGRPTPIAAGTIATLPDSALVRRAVAGDVTAFGHLVQRYQRPMSALVSRMTDQPDEVDDIVQELFVRAWKGLPRFRGDAQFSTWIYRVAVNTTIKHRSRRRGEASLSLSAEDLTRGIESLVAPAEASEAQGTDPMVTTMRREREAEIRAAVQALPEKQRVVVVLHYYEGMSCEEIGQIVECSIGTVWSRLHYACKRLKGVLETGAMAEASR